MGTNWPSTICECNDATNPCVRATTIAPNTLPFPVVLSACNGGYGHTFAPLSDYRLSSFPPIASTIFVAAKYRIGELPRFQVRGEFGVPIQSIEHVYHVAQLTLPLDTFRDP